MKYLNFKLLILFAALALAIPPAWAETVTDVLMYSTIGTTGTTYKNFSGIMSNSSAVYAGNTAGGNNSIQLRSNNSNSGIVTTTSGGKVSKIEIEFNTNTSGGRTVDVYGKNSAYSSASDLYGNNAGTKLGSLTYLSSATVSLSVTGDYEYIGLRSSSGALYIDVIRITWETGESTLIPVTLEFPDDEYTAYLGHEFSVPLSVEPVDAASEVVYSSSDENVATVASDGSITLVNVGTTTITASISDSETYKNVTASYTLNVVYNPSEVATLDFTDANHWNPDLPTSATTSGTYNDGTYSVSLSGNDFHYNNSSGGYLLLGKTNATLTLPAFTSPVEKIVIEGSSGASGSVLQNFFVGDNPVSTQTTGATGTNTYVIASGYQAAGNVYTLKVLSNHNTQIKKIYVYFKEQTGDPELSFNPASQTINEDGYTFKLHGENIGGNVGVYVVGDDPEYSNEFSFSLPNGNQQYSYFAPDNQGRINNEDVVVTYTGRALNAQGKIGAAWGDVKAFAEVDYKSDIYIVGDFGTGWDFTDGNRLMSESGGIYTYELNVENSNTFIVFARKVGEGVGFNTRYTFTPISEGNWEMNADEKEGSLNFYGAQPIHFQYPGLYAIEIDASDNTFTITRTLPQVAKPVISPNGGNFVVSQTVTIASETEGAAIYYTTDETEPSAQNGTLYEGEITLNSNTVIKAIAVKDGMRPSEVATATFTKTGLDNLADVIALGGSKNFSFAGEVVVTHVGTYGSSKLIGLRDLSQNNANGTGGGVFYDTPSNVDLKAGDILAPGWSGRTSKYGANWIEITNATNVTTNGTATVMPFDRTGVTLTAANQSEYIILSDVTIDTQAKTATWTDGSTTVTYSLYNRYDGVTYDDGKYEYMICLVSAYGQTPQVYPIELKKAQQVATPTITPDGGEFTAAQEVTIATTTEGATLYYSLDGENWTAGNTLTVDHSGKVYAKATKVGMNDSEVAEATFTINYPAITVTLEPDTETYTVGDDDAKVKVTVANTVGAATVTYMIGETAETANTPVTPEDGYITIPTDEAGTVVLKVTASDAYHAEPVTAIGTYTVNEKPLAVTLPAAPAEPYKVGQEVKVKATVENGSENTVLTYKVGDETLTIGEDGNVTLPNKKAGEVVLTVTAVDDDKQATDSKTYVFDAADELTITLTPATGSYYVGAEQNVTVTVEGAIATNPTITYKFGEEGEVQTYNAETGIVLPTAQAGTINLTVMVDDDGYEHDGATTATGTYTVNHKALTITLDPETKTFTVGDVAKVKVTIENAVGTPTVTCKVGDETLDLVDGYVTLPDTKKAGEEVTLTVTARDEREGAQDVVKTGTYTFTAAPAITFGMDVVHEPEGDTYHVGDVVKVKVANVENNIGNVTVTYKIGDTELVPDENGYVTIPTNEVTDVTLTVTVKDAYEHSTEATQNFVFNIAAADAITFTLTPDGGEYTVGDKVNVKVSNIQNTIGVYTITYTTNSTREPQTYDPEKGIDITSDEAGQVNLTVTVTDAYEHEAEGTKSAVYKFAAAPAIEITLNPDGGEYIVGDVVNVTVAVAKTLGDYTVVYQIDGGEVQNYDAATGIVITRSTVGNVDLKITVTDGYEHEGDGTASATYVFKPVPVVAAPTFSLASGTYDTPQDVTISGPEGATIYYSVDGGLTWTEGNSLNMTETTILMAKAVKDGYESPVVTNAYVIKQTVERIPVEPIDGYFSIKNNGNNMFANVQGRKTLTFCDDAAKEAQAGTVIYVNTDEYGQVQSLRSQAADLQGYADRAMRYVPEVVQLVVDKLHATGVGSLLGEDGYDAIKEKFNESFDYHLYVEKDGENYRIYGKTPSMQPVVDFYAENMSRVDEKLPQLEGFINDAIDKVLNKTQGHGASILVDYDLEEVWQRMGGNLTKPEDEASTMAFYRQVLCNKDNVWDFAYQSVMIYWERLKNHDLYEQMKEELGEFAQYVDKLEQVLPDMKYYIVADGNKVDFISAGNKDIHDGAARTYWTLEPRTTFTKNFDETNYFGCINNKKYVSTLYTDFAYTLPEDVKAYKVIRVNANGLATLEALSGAIPAQTPVLLMSEEAGGKVLTLATTGTADMKDNLLVGPDYLIDEYKLVTPQVQALFDFVKQYVSDEFYNTYVTPYEHLMYKNSGTVGNKYFWGLPSSDLDLCVYTNEENSSDCVVRSLGVSEATGTFGFVDHWSVRTNEAFLVSSTVDEIKLSNKGDVNHDGVVDINDVTLTISYVLGVPTPDCCPYCADVVEDGLIDINDVAELISIVLGK